MAHKLEFSFTVFQRQDFPREVFMLVVSPINKIPEFFCPLTYFLRSDLPGLMGIQFFISLTWRNFLWTTKMEMVELVN